MSYFRSSIGAKQIMAVTGLVLVLFLIGHLLGNLLIFAGQDAFNAYAAGLKSMGNGAVLWIVRGGLLFVFLIHIMAAVRLVAINKRARPQKYAVYKPVRSPFYARVMPLSGLIVLAFVIYHLLHYTVGVSVENFDRVDALGRHDIYNIVIEAFQNPLVAGWYILAMALLCFHLAHGVSSFFQTLGANHPKYNRIFRLSGPVLATILFLGFSSIPAAILARIVVGA